MFLLVLSICQEDTRERKFYDCGSLLILLKNDLILSENVLGSGLGSGPYCLPLAKTAKAQQGLRTFNLLKQNLKLECCLPQELIMVALYKQIAENREEN